MTLKHFALAALAVLWAGYLLTLTGVHVSVANNLTVIEVGETVPPPSVVLAGGLLLVVVHPVVFWLATRRWRT
jgi:hypothetical protein